MAITKEKKKNIVSKIKEELEKQKIIIFVAINGIKAKDIFDLRKNLKEKDSKLTVIKKTLLKVAAKDLPVDVKKLEGELGLIFGFGDELSAAKITKKFSSLHDNLKILGGIFNNEFIEKDKVLVFADIPSKEQLIANTLYTIKAPVSGFVNVLNANIKGLINVLKAINK